MKILLGVHQFFPGPPGGTEILTLELARHLRTRGHTVAILAGVAEPAVREVAQPWLTQDEYDGLVVYRLHYGGAEKRDPISLHLAAPDRVRLIRDLVSSLRPDVVHFTHLLGFSGQAIPEIHGMGIPVVFTPTDFWAVCPKFTLCTTYDKTVCQGPGEGANCVRCFQPMPSWAARLALKVSQSPLRRLSGRVNSVYALGRRVTAIADDVNAANRVLPSTRFLADVLIRHGVEPGRVHVVPYGIDVGHLSDHVAIPDRFTEAQPLRIGFIGTFSELKGPHVLLDALTHLGDKRLRITLDLYGGLDETDPYCRILRNRATALGNRVRFKGVFPQERIGEILRGLHVLAVPSLWYESMPLVLCAGLRAGTPVVVSRLGGLTEAIREGSHGFSFPAGDAPALGSLIAGLVDDPGRLTIVRQRVRVQDRSTSDYVRDVEEEYLQVVSGAGVP